MKKLGLHIRLNETVKDAIDKAQYLHLPTFQNFFVKNDTKYVAPSDNDIKNFLYARKEFDDLFLHCSFWVNLCNPRDYNVKLFAKEIELAKKLEYTHVILHPGSAKAQDNKMAGMDLLARRLDKFLKQEKNIKIVLENTAHAKLTIGSSLRDFKTLQDKLDNQLYYCIDTAHAYAHGYDIKNDPSEFINDIKLYMGLNNVALIHLNDSMENLGSNKDRHGIPGQGKIGLEPLQNFIKQPEFTNLPIILELPPTLNEEEEQKALDLFR